MEANQLIEVMLNNSPLIGFSVYTEIQSRIIQNLGQEFLTSLDSGIVPDGGTGKGAVIDGEVFNRGYGQFWLWVLAEPGN